MFIVSGLKVVTMRSNWANVFALFVQSNSQSAVLFVKVKYTPLYVEH